MIKILHVISSLQTGGAEKLMVDLLPRLRDKGIECELLTFDNTTTPFRKNLEDAGIRVYDFGKSGSPYNLRNLVKLLPFLRKYDIVHTHTTACQLFAAIGSILCPAVLCTTEHSTSNRRRSWKWFAPIDRWMYSHYKAVISISDKTQEKLLEYMSIRSVTYKVIYNGIPVEDYANAKPKDEIEQDYPETKRIFMVAGFRHQKDQPTVIRALLSLPSNYHLFLVGDGAEKQKCINLTAELNLSNRVHFLGRRTDVAALLKSADICVISSLWEGFGLAAVEGMAAGVPVIASDVPGLAEVVGGAGILFEQGNETELAKYILQLTTDKVLYESIVEKGSKRAGQYSIENMTQGYRNLYYDLLK